jgi:hypothetical protein
MDPEKRKELQLLMGGGLRSSDGRLAPRLAVSSAQVDLFSLGPMVELPPRNEQDSAKDLERCFEAEGFTVTSRDLPGVPKLGAAFARPPSSGTIVADREVAPDGAYNRSTRWVCGSLILAWFGSLLLIELFLPNWWIQAVFVGGFLLGLPAFVISSYRGLGYTSVVVVARLESVWEPPPKFDGVIPTAPMRVTIGAGWVRSRQPIGRNLGGRRIVSVVRRPDLGAVTESIYRRWNHGTVIGAVGTSPPP